MFLTRGDLERAEVDAREALEIAAMARRRSFAPRSPRSSSPAAMPPLRAISRSTRFARRRLRIHPKPERRSHRSSSRDRSPRSATGANPNVSLARHGIARANARHAFATLLFARRFWRRCRSIGRFVCSC